jgi:hypothetical protein
MRRIASVLASLVLSFGLWASGEALVMASPVATTGGPGGPTTCLQAQTARLAHQKAFTLAQAKRCWPEATVSPDGSLTSAGRKYIVPHDNGWVLAGFNVTTQVDGRPLSSRDALAYSCGQSVSITVDSWEQYLTYLDWHTGNTVVVCSYAYNNWKTPRCQGFGNCAPPQTGVIGNYTSTVNPWYNQTVFYGFGTDTFFCRHYIHSDTSIQYWCD